ncbi:hypothetical protein GAP53_11030 [Bacteroides uniformis]|uniref:Uncharacterized protein n=1 Tax=Bacteroides uniformis TaxID=820 RepID=A0A4Q5E4B1_BACUN|nr:hypothetical protein [Bacteroides uniformis]KAB4218069.1 hypothetical protein GAP45_17310 [Bacteroides uniformis]KAB4221958.1 hypothetical protein GAP53_11030 [Bacteroides uniformis]KAB4228992.1 hypothetical protein GAP44_11845 [Bacteroides uniformis]KAB4238602.1 hypothetical protein GAP41_18005 [Bacteroides uniformis]KAB4239674.1 hypothetical protein GAP54_13420 [Bacteroides uniformis]
MTWDCQISVDRQTGYLDIIESVNNDRQCVLPAIKEYVECYNTLYEKPSLMGSGTFQFYLVIHRCSDLYYDKYTEENDRERYVFKQKELVFDREKLPIIHLSIFDLFNTNCRLRYKRFIDSSIWNYYVPIEVGSEGYNFQRFKHAIKEISENALNKLYDFPISKEFVDLNARLLQISYIKNFDDKSHKGHANFISPFLFHSEWEMRDRIKKDKPQNESNVFHKYLTHHKWRILLVDDYANTSLMKDESSNSEGLDPHGKLKIIINDINKIGAYNIAWCSPSPNDFSIIRQNTSHLEDIHLQWKYENTDNNSETNIYIVYVQTKEEAWIITKYFKFDFILLDYLLGESGDVNQREYTYELLDKIREEYDNVQKDNKLSIPEKRIALSWIAPLNKLYFMYISAFVPAISERLQEQGLIRDTPYWHIARGACPTNTPYLFLYYLYRLMEKRYNEMSLGKESGMSGHTLVDFLNNIFDDDFKKVKYRASKYFNTLLNLRNKYDIMKHDVYDEDFDLDWLHKRGSLLVYSLFPDIKCYSNAFWEHMQQLIYLVAFGTVRQWPEMWEEYVFVRDRLKEAEQKVQSVNNCPFRKVRLLSDKIEDYIILLRNR